MDKRHEKGHDLEVVRLNYWGFIFFQGFKGLAVNWMHFEENLNNCF